jgi:predicted transglutaminase-like cysteine proteinase
MGFLGHVHALRAAIFACGLAFIGPAASAGAANLQISGSLERATEPAEPFGLFATRIDWGGIVTKWLAVLQRLDDERVQLALCDGDREHCASDAALKFLAIVDSARQREGRARLGEINRAVNLAIHPMSDLAQFGEVDVWSSPLITFYRGAGDCEDYAIAKFVGLRMAGIPAEDLRIVVMADLMRGEGHAVAVVRFGGHWLILDNRRMAIMEDVSVRNYRPLFVIDQSGVMKYSEVPALASLSDLDAAPPPTNDRAGLALRPATSAQDAGRFLL